ncbi:1564_t:CDS:2 [Entrophospora sp. SA101]|nr:1564_t:CDS:2 [Entrophospora sp. SA101]
MPKKTKKPPIKKTKNKPIIFSEVNPSFSPSPSPPPNKSSPSLTHSPSPPPFLSPSPPFLNPPPVVSNEPHSEVVNYCWIGNKRTRERNVERTPTPKIIRNLEKLERKKILFTIITSILITGYLFITFLYKIKYTVGFCDSDSGTIEKGNHLCTSCPDFGICKDGRLVACEEGFIIFNSSFSFINPLLVSCEIDSDQVVKVSKYANAIKKTSAKELGNIECGYGDRENLEIDNIKLKIRKEMDKDSDQDFEKLFESSLSKLKGEGHVVVEKEEIRQLYMRKRKEKATIKRAVDVIYDILEIESEIISLQWRDQVLSFVEDPFHRKKLWDEVENMIRKNPLVRLSNTTYEGSSTYSLEWVGHKDTYNATTTIN